MGAVTLYALLRERCGLSLREAANFHDVAMNTVESWSSGRRPAPDGVVSELRRLYAKIEDAAYQEIADKEGAVDLILASDDTEAASLGWPCVGAHAAMLGIAAALTHKKVTIAQSA